MLWWKDELTKQTPRSRNWVLTDSHLFLGSHTDPILTLRISRGGSWYGVDTHLPWLDLRGVPSYGPLDAMKKSVETSIREWLAHSVADTTSLVDGAGI